ncbi:OLC1v1003027C1 [Oldenlandia corymbosa var. corymbosa]|uniref:Carboxypeptidase n=1 Tax=Oldenlandia corymbosa var. corymbosa TaxID=529605 RepID=A0AAV1DBG0_OLDCO|nr:OLC1v1003027C1 [Oldenlandia corymbosa var. corymbosa]
MEERRVFYSIMLNFFVHVLLIFPGLVQSFGKDQAGSLMSFRRAKRVARNTIKDMDLTFETLMSLEDGTKTTFFDGGKMEDDLIRNGLPGQPAGVTFKQYAGYVDVDKASGRSLFYYFAEAAEDPHAKPLLLWLNGGPGCSSLGYGAMIELGPFGVNPDGKTLYLREYAWNRAANTLFLESPAGVGFSYSNTTSDYKIAGDKRTAEDAYTFLVNWFKRFPHYKARDFYIMGESYAGHYVPQLADIIIKKNAMVGSATKIQLKGIMIGNGVLNDEIDAKGTYDFLWTHALISDEMYQRLRDTCMVETKVCEQVEDAGKLEFGDIDMSNIYGPLCSPSDTEALHANQTNLPPSWQLCSDIINDWQDSPSSMFPVYKRLAASGLRILQFSGDVDVIVSVTSTRYSIEAMKMKVIKPWRPWLDESYDVAGYEVTYDGLTFATVREAGHQVPEYQPRRALALLNRHLRTRSSKMLVNFATEEDVDYNVGDSSPVCVGSPQGSKAADKITALPGQPNGIKFDQYSGYVTVDPNADRALFYWFVESHNSSSKKPLVLWLNGGPGCSSLGAGALTELGPFRVNSDGKTLWQNPYAWNNVANVLFLESPAGVGFSYSNTTSGYVVGDKRTAEDSYTFLVNWLERFPEYKARDFFIAGESYAGHYVPQLAQYILKKNKITNHIVVNLKGIAVNECAQYRNEAYAAQGNIDPYNIYAPICLSSSSNSSLSSQRPPSVSQFDPCISNYVHAYLNTPEVQQSFHANITGSLPGTWEICNYFMNENWQDEPKSVLPVIKKLIRSGVSVWLYCPSPEGRLNLGLAQRSSSARKLEINLKVCLFVASVQCYVGVGNDPLTEHLRSRSSKESFNFLTEEDLDNNVRYSPVYVGSQDGLKAADQITALPGQPDGLSFNQYAGYVTVDPNAGRALFYYFAESENSSSKPLVLWLNGGPGCSSLGAGAFAELGPFRVNSDGKTLWQNPYAWNTAANVLFLESPAGVGFSYSNTSSDYVTGDKRTAADSYTFLINWLERFPEYKTREFFLTGESYAGHYVPQLAQLILQNNKIMTNQTVINLKGIAIGNAYVDVETQNRGVIDYILSHALISDEIYQGIISNCNFSFLNPSSDACKQYQDQATAAEGDINPYNIYAPLCLSPSRPPPRSEFDPCTGYYIDSYLNTPEVQQSLHANITGLPGPWGGCNDSIRNHWQDEPDSVLPVIKELTTSGISVWMYSGDVDSVVPVTTTRYAITKMGFSVKTPWYPWYTQDEVGGYAVGYDQNFTFVTSYAGIGNDPLTKHLRSRRPKTASWVHSPNEEGFKYDGYSPVYVGSQEGLKAADKISALPGQPDGVAFGQYAGYVTVDPEAGRALFYYFAESENSSSKPLVLWLNGGPGCSSLGAGAFKEIGPFRVNSDGKTLWRNPHAWNTAANVIFLESPAGVGFSYSNTSTDYVTGDKQTAADSYTFLVNWWERFPEYKTRDFFITGESYAGHYVPQLAQLILKNNKITNQTVINLKGIAIGNAYIDLETQNRGLNDFSWSHGLIPDEIYQGIISNCNFSMATPSSEACKQYQEKATAAAGHINEYNIYAPLCSSPSQTPPSISEFDPCSDDYIESYLNTPNVQQSLHANTTGGLPGPWGECSNFVHGNWEDEPDSVLDVIKELTTTGISVWIYSGDTDCNVPVTTTRYAITKMGFSVKTPWFPWYHQNEVGGYTVWYENFTFVTVRGSGHFVPSYQPARALTMFTSFLEGKLPPSTKMTPTLASVLAKEDFDNVEYSPVYTGSQDGLKEADRITELPGQPNEITFNQYAGYVTVNPIAGRALFYYFTECDDNPSSKPLVLWLNGGPGCSSIGSGALEELGPFRVSKDGKTLWQNPYAWNKVANVIFLESPAGVGFSYSNRSLSDYVTGDEETAADSYTFLVNWLERFPEYKSRDFFITGESYAGHYVPQLAQLILQHNNKTNQSAINLRGIAIGNALLDIETQNQGTLDFMWTHALISDEIHQSTVSNCNFSLADPLSEDCQTVFEILYRAQGNIFPYNIYAPLCNSSAYFSTPPNQSIHEFDPCSDDYVAAYLNIPEVQQSLHANTTQLPGPWITCSDFVGNNWKDAPDTVLPVIKELMSSGLRVWIFSGDTDSVVPVTSTRYALSKMNLSIGIPWYPWYTQGEVGGYAVGYENLTFVTVRGAGHFVPSYQPARAFTLFSSFLDGNLPPYLS